MAPDGRGMSWSPLSIVAEDIAAGGLARVKNVAVSMGVRLFRSKAGQSPAALWERAVSLVRKGKPVPPRRSSVSRHHLDIAVDLHLSNQIVARVTVLREARDGFT
jgi:hypothetical protein